VDRSLLPANTVPRSCSMSFDDTTVADEIDANRVATAASLFDSIVVR
jgi:hypothetical protein